jgi:large subunit ribosomal protein L15
MPIHRRLPKRGFTNIFKKNILIVNLKDLVRFENGALVDGKALADAGLIKGAFDGIKLLGKGEVNSALTIKVNAVSKSAQEKIEKAGGKIEVI